MNLVPIQQLADEFGVKRKSIRQAARRHEAVAAAIEKTEDGEVVVDADAFAVWWNESRDEHMDKVRRGLGG